MARKKPIQSDGNVPYLNDLVSFYKHVNAGPPMHKDFDIREIDPEVLKSYDFVTQPFRHSFYCITLLLSGDITLNTGFWQNKLDKPALYFKTPNQIVSWIKPEVWLKEYFIVFTESFLLKHKALSEIVFGLPFFKLEKAIPFEIGPEEVKMLTDIYKQIFAEYHSDHTDKFELIVSYTQALLIHVRRLYVKYADKDHVLSEHINRFDHLLVEKFRTLIRKQLSENIRDGRTWSIKSFAAQLGTHPNHLNAVIKRQTKKTAIAFMHELFVFEAQSLLCQTDLNIKEIAYRLGFNEVSHFNHFFKKQTNTTPALYRKAGRL